LSVISGVSKSVNNIRLESVYIDGVRNISAQRLVLNPRINLISGANGSGKSSIIEAFSLLSTGRSFRSSSIRSLIQHGRDECVVQARVESGGATRSLGIRRTKTGELTLRCDGEPVGSLAEFVAQVPTIILDPSSTDIITGPPEPRRRLIDGTLFHVEPGFLDVWRRYQRLLKQRNAMLRRGMMPGQDPWLDELSRVGSILTGYRVNLVSRLGPVFQTILAELNAELADAELVFRPGWDSSLSLELGMARSVGSDVAQGFTHVGPHRADLRLQWQGRAMAEVFSRGQLKLAMIALRLAQGRVLAASEKGAPLYLVDDLTAELDGHHALQVCRMLEQARSQVVLTTVSELAQETLWMHDVSAVFHVEQGCVSAAVDNTSATKT
jgi:DNA replication and repair protein RecF